MEIIRKHLFWCRIFYAFLILVFSSLCAEAQEDVVVKGHVVSKMGESIPGANISVKGTTQGCISDLNGNFSLPKVPMGTTLQISFIGYQTEEVAVENRDFLEIILISDNESIDEVVVVGYGTQKKANLTGAVATVTPKALETRPITNVSSGLQGRVPGLTIVQGTGQPGRDGGSMRIRGVGTFGNNNPLILIDGMEGSMDDLNPDDIESISVLKDAASSAIYGSRAANGVVLVTTKKGKPSKKVNVTYNFYWGWQEETNLPSYLNSADYASLYNEALENDGQNPAFSDEEIRKYADGSDPDHYPNTDWLGAIFSEKGYQQNHSLSISGGKEKMHYNISLRYFDQDGLVKKTSNKRYNFRMNLSNEIGKRLHTNFILSASRQNVTQPNNPFAGGLDQIIRQAHRIPPTVVNKYSDGTYGHHTDGNPVAWIEDGAETKSEYDRVVANMEAIYDLAKGLTVTGRMGIYSFDDFGKTHIKDRNYYIFGTDQVSKYEGPSSVSDYNSRSLDIKQELLLNYSKVFAEKHKISFLAGVSQQENEYKENTSFRKNLAGSEMTEVNGGEEEGQRGTGYSKEWALRSQFGRVNYNFDDRFLFEANVRRDGSSRFHPDHRWGVFPSFSGGWRLSQEEFMQSLSWLDNLKIRASWGQLGNQDIGKNLYPYQSTIDLGAKYPFNNTIEQGTHPGPAVVENISWETATTYNVGLDFSVFQGLLSMSMEYYNMLTEDILLRLPVHPVFGLAAPYQNAGSVRNKGWEFNVSHVNTIGDFHYEANVNMSVNDNVVEDLSGTQPDMGTQTIQEGVSYKAFYGYENLGLFQSQEEIDNAPDHPTAVKPGDIRFKDQNDDGKIDGDDRVVLGNSFPGITYGIDLAASYKGFDCNLFFSGAADILAYLSSAPVAPFPAGGKPNKMQQDRWTETNTDASYPRLSIKDTYNFAASDYWIRNASFLRLKNLQVGYNFPKAWMEKAGIEGLRLYVSGENLLTITGFEEGFDPETPNTAYDYYYPQVKIFSFGLTAKF